jgi:hypothetical protein
MTATTMTGSVGHGTSWTRATRLALIAITFIALVAVAFVIGRQTGGTTVVKSTVVQPAATHFVPDACHPRQPC